MHGMRRGGMRKIEDTLLNNYKKTTPVIFLIISLIYILNVNNHYRLLLDEDERLRNEIKSLRHDYQVTDRFIKKIFRHADSVGGKFPVFDNHVLRDGYKIVVLKDDFSDEAIINNIARIVNKIKNEKEDIKIIMFSHGAATNKKNIHDDFDKVFFVDQPSILFIGDQNQILCAFSLDGKESIEELQLISKYMLEIISGQFKKLR